MDWADIEGRIQYAYYTNDARALDGVLTSLRAKPAEGEDEGDAADLVTRSYFRALAHYRVAQVLMPSKKSQAKDAADDCEDEVDRSVAALPKIPIGLDETDDSKHRRAEAQTLAAACALAGRELTSDAGGSRVAEAIKLEPRNPRVRLFEALVAYGDAGKDPKAKAAAIQKLRAVTQMFEAARAGISRAPEWGAAEAYAYLGRALYEQRDVVGAREALERALLVSPEYAFARKLMSQITR
jgi:tetratricopeptide (TPR) repeat protein